jgi:hypothetical protein
MKGLLITCTLILQKHVRIGRRSTASPWCLYVAFLSPKEEPVLLQNALAVEEHSTRQKA